jgi:hypothetical protein
LKEKALLEQGIDEAKEQIRSKNCGAKRRPLSPFVKKVAVAVVGYAKVAVDIC